ncbi:MAG: glucose-6-phosphate isomerase [Pseudomonadota bacterium]
MVTTVTTARRSAMADLHHQAEKLRAYPLADWLQGEEAEARRDKLSWRFAGWTLDASRQRLTPAVLQDLVRWAEACGLTEQRRCLFAGEVVNRSEGRPALHPALRWPPDLAPPPGLEAHVAQALAQRRKMAGLVEHVRRGQWQGATGEVITDLVHIGVGGSDLGPRLASQGLVETHPAGGVKVHFVSTMDATQLVPLLDSLNPATTLVIMASKSFTTADTQFNLATALHWLEASLPASREALLAHQLVGISARPGKMTDFGIPAAHQLTLAEGVGGRFSLWSPIGLALAVQIGMPAFERLLAGAHAMDRHFREMPTERNLPALLALLGAWNSQFLGIPSHAVLPYDGRLASLPAYLQQLEMESNGKSVTPEGQGVGHATCPILWGDVGPNAQHAFYQLLHQGTHTVSVDFITVARRHGQQPGHRQAPLQAQQRLTLAHCLAQAQLMALGDEAIPAALKGQLAEGYRGNQPSSLLLLDELTPWALGALMALYEHKVFVQSLLWNLNPFDQPGVELGKRLAEGLYHELQGEPADPDQRIADASTEALLARLTGKASL